MTSGTDQASDRAFETLLKAYELSSAEKVASASRFFQVQALAITIIWGGFALFATQTSPGSLSHLLISIAAASIASLYCCYWIIAAASFRFSEQLLDFRLRRLESLLHLDAVIDATDTLTEQERISKLVRLLSWRPPYPVSIFLGFVGIAAWGLLVAVSALVYAKVVGA